MIINLKIATRIFYKYCSLGNFDQPKKYEQDKSEMVFPRSQFQDLILNKQTKTLEVFALILQTTLLVMKADYLGHYCEF